MTETLNYIKPKTGNGIRILVVEDDKHIRRVISMGLSLEGYEVLTAENGRDALEKLLKYGAHVVTLDLMMPVMDGRAFIHKVRNEVKTNIPIVVLTSVDREEATRDLLDSGADAILHKPATVAEIVATLKAIH